MRRDRYSTVHELLETRERLLSGKQSALDQFSSALNDAHKRRKNARKRLLITKSSTLKALIG